MSRTICIMGGKGKLGSLIAEVAKRDNNLVNIVDMGDNFLKNATAAEVLVDCTTAKAFIENIENYRKIRKPIVIATTGFSQEEEMLIKELAKEIPIIKSSNFSIEVYKFREVVKFATKLFGKSCDIGVSEKHHKFKKDSPSGTAKDIVNDIKKVISNKEIEVHSYRLSDIVGEHEVVFVGTKGERVELAHKTYSRDSFAQGIALALEWIMKQSPGKEYCMSDMMFDILK